MEGKRTMMITERRQIQAIADLIGGQKPEIGSEQMTEDFAWLHNLVANAAPGQVYSLLAQLKMEKENRDIAPLLDEIMAATPGLRLTHPSLAQLGPDLPRVQWLWPQWIPRGLLTLLAAWPGVGKTYVALDIAHRLISHLPTPDGGTFQTSSPPNVIYVDAEDFLPAIYERAMAWGMGDTRFYPVQRPPRHLIDLADPLYQDHLIDMAYDLRPALIIVDSLSSVNSRGENNVEDLRDVLGFLVELAREYECGLLLIHHLRKPRGTITQPITMHDLRGSGHLIAMARSVIGLDVLGSERDPNGPRNLKVLKTNLAKYPKPLAVEFAPSRNPDVATLRYGDIARFNPPTDIELCADWLLDRLKSGPQSYTSLKEQLVHELGFNETTLQRARKHLGEQIVDTLGPRRKGNEWALAQQDH